MGYRFSPKKSRYSVADHINVGWLFPSIRVWYSGIEFDKTTKRMVDNAEEPVVDNRFLK
jgi:hypothetical protein